MVITPSAPSAVQHPVDDEVDRNGQQRDGARQEAARGSNRARTSEVDELAQVAPWCPSPPAAAGCPDPGTTARRWSGTRSRTAGRTRPAAAQWRWAGSRGRSDTAGPRRAAWPLRYSPSPQCCATARARRNTRVESITAMMITMKKVSGMPRRGAQTLAMVIRQQRKDQRWNRHQRINGAAEDLVQPAAQRRRQEPEKCRPERKPGRSSRRRCQPCFARRRSGGTGYRGPI